ncbi:MAG TPA: hypothetical protein VKM55_26105 [Candidatus Lokiarchaeia archaeon]|nr:hypothetical protein [Candidatus Lokiarchaeia archaeon]
MHTGDVGIFDEDGYLRIVDRLKDMIIVGGYKVFSSKVEDIIVKHPAIEMVALIGTPSADRPGSENVEAYISLSPEYKDVEDEEHLKGEIIDWLKDKLAPYEVPKKITFSDALPLTIVGKIDKKELRKKSMQESS